MSDDAPDTVAGEDARDDDTATADDDRPTDDESGSPTDTAAETPSVADAPATTAEGKSSTDDPQPGVPDDGESSEDDVTRQSASGDGDDSAGTSPQPGVPEDVQKYDRFQKMDGAQYDRVNEFLRDRTYITAREWAIARLCADFRTETGVEMTKIGENLPELVPFMTDTYSPQAVNQARSSFEDKVRTAGATFLYGAMSDFFTAEELDEVMYETTEVAKFLLEVEGVDLSVEEELEAEDRISGVMREVRASSEELRHDGTECPECGHEIAGDD